MCAAFETTEVFESVYLDPVSKGDEACDFAEGHGKLASSNVCSEGLVWIEFTGFGAGGMRLNTSSQGPAVSWRPLCSAGWGSHTELAVFEYMQIFTCCAVAGPNIF